MEKVETKYGILISVIGVWFLLDGILNLISNWNIRNWNISNWSIPINLIIGILVFIAGLLIYKGNSKGGMLALISGIIGITPGVIVVILNFYPSYYPLNLMEILIIMGSIVRLFSLPTLLLIAGIEKSSLKVGVLITTMGAFMVTSYAMYMLSNLILSNLILVWIVMDAIFTTTGGLGIVAGVSINQRLSRGYKLSILAGIIGIIAATAYAIIMILIWYAVLYLYTPLSTIIYWIILPYQPPTIFLLGGILARERSTITWINPGFSIDDRMIFA